MDLSKWPDWPESRTAIIAEIGMNHGGDEKLAFEMIRIAHDSGADFVKLQSYVMEDFFHPSLPYYHDTESMGLSFDTQRRLYEASCSKGIKLITTPYDAPSVDLFEEFDPPAHKVASMDNDNLPLIRYIAGKGRPVLISCGMADLGEIQKVTRIMQEAGNDKLVLLHCVSDYPTKPEDLNLAMIRLLKRTFGFPVGLSDHSLGLDSSFVAAAMQVAVIEKHFTTDRSLLEKIPEADHDISIEPDELRKLRDFCEAVPGMMGKALRPLTENEVQGRKVMRRGLYAKLDISQGEKLSLENTAFLRPVKGIPAGDWDHVCGKESLHRIEKLAPIMYSDLKI
jgi:N,N'-diacetyllegionaminate synthase